MYYVGFLRIQYVRERLRPILRTSRGYFHFRIEEKAASLGPSKEAVGIEEGCWDERKSSVQWTDRSFIFSSFILPTTMRPRIIPAYVMRRRVIETPTIDDRLPGSIRRSITWLSSRNTVLIRSINFISQLSS